MNKPFKHLVLEAVLNGASTVSDVLAVVGSSISASKAANESRKEYKADLKRGRLRPQPTAHRHAERGRRRLVSENLLRLCREGKIVRIGRGTYTAPPPKIYHPQAS